MSFLLPDRGPALKFLLQKLLFIAFPLLVGWFVYSWAIPGVASPVELRIQHPTLPQEYEKQNNPYREKDPETQRRCKSKRVRFSSRRIVVPVMVQRRMVTGLFANSFRLRPINFQDPGTIATVVDNYVFWRIKEGAPGLPTESTPWDSAMPSWKDDLKDDEVWKIIMGEYDTAGVLPRQREKAE